MTGLDPIPGLALGVLSRRVNSVLAATFFTVEQRTMAMVQRLGEFVRGSRTIA